MGSHVRSELSGEGTSHSGNTKKTLKWGPAALRRHGNEVVHWVIPKREGPDDAATEVRGVAERWVDRHAENARELPESFVSAPGVKGGLEYFATPGNEDEEVVVAKWTALIRVLPDHHDV